MCVCVCCVNFIESVRRCVWVKDVCIWLACSSGTYLACTSVTFARLGWMSFVCGLCFV